MKHFLLKVISNQVNSRDISFLWKIREMLNRKKGDDDNTEQDEIDYLKLIDLINSIYLIAIDKKIDD